MAELSSISDTRCAASSALSLVSFRSATISFSFPLTSCLKLARSLFISLERLLRKQLNSTFMSERIASIYLWMAPMLACKLSIASSLSVTSPPSFPVMFSSLFSWFWVGLPLDFHVLSPDIIDLRFQRVETALI